MRLDSERQRKLLVDLILTVPVQTDIRGLMEGLRPDIKTLLQAIQAAQVGPEHTPEETDDGTDAPS